MEKIKIRKKINFFDESILEGNINVIQSNLSKVIKELEKLGWEDVELVQEGYYEHSEIVAYGYILESDSEYEKRLKENQIKLDKEKKKLEKQAKQYQKLKEQFEPSNTIYKCCDNPEIETFLENNSGLDVSGQQLYGPTTVVFRCKNCGGFCL